MTERDLKKILHKRNNFAIRKKSTLPIKLGQNVRILERSNNKKSPSKRPCQLYATLGIYGVEKKRAPFNEMVRMLSYKKKEVDHENDK